MNKQNKNTVIKRIALSVLIISFLPFFFSCSSAKFDEVSFEKAYQEGNYKLCIKMLKGKDYGKDMDTLKNIDIGVLAHYAKDYKLSSKHFNEGDRLLDSGKVDGVAQFESFYLNILNALNYYHQNKLEDAVAELKKADNEKILLGRQNKKPLWYIIDESPKVELIRGFDEDEEPSEELKQAYKTFGIKPAEINEGIPRKPTNMDLYRGSSTAYYLGAIMRNANGDEEGARLDKDYLGVHNSNPDVNNVLNANLNIIAFSGQIAQKEEAVFYFPKEKDGEAFFLRGISIPVNGVPFNLPPIRFKFAYPKVGENITNIDRIEAVITDTATGKSETHTFTLLEDFGEEIKKNTALRARKEYQITAAKSILGKLTASISSATTIFAARKTLEKAGNPITKAAAQKALDIAEAALPIALDDADKSITADITQAKFLPAKSSVLNISLSPAVYNIKVRYLRDSIPVFEEEFDKVEIKEKGLNLLESKCLK